MRKMKSLTDNIRKIIGGRGFLTAALIMGAVGMLLILFSSGSGDRKKTERGDELTFVSSEEYRQSLEERLENMLSRIQGVGDVKVTITLGATEEYIYAEENKVNGDRISNEYVIADKGGIITRIDSPQITGAVIVCEGGGNTQVCEKVYKAVSVSLGIPANRICVVKMK